MFSRISTTHSGGAPTARGLDRGLGALAPDAAIDAAGDAMADTPAEGIDGDVPGDSVARGVKARASVAPPGTDHDTGGSGTGAVSLW